MPLLRRRELIAGSVVALALPEVSAANVLGSASSDNQLLARLIEIEQAIVFGYRRVLSSAVLSRASAPVAAGFLPHEQEHVRLLSAQLSRRGGSPTPAAAERTLRTLGLLARPHDSPDAVRYLISLETLAENAYYNALARLTDPALLRLTVEIMACEAQHWTGLSGLLHAGDVYSAVPQPTVSGG
jgi:hypothetical protein